MTNNPRGKSHAKCSTDPTSVLMDVLLGLLDQDFVIADLRATDNGWQIDLDFGPVINIYYTGRVLVRGRLVESVPVESLALLREEILPPSARWQLRGSG